MTDQIFIIKVDPKSIKRNPDAGRTTFLVPGRTTVEQIRIVDYHEKPRYFRGDTQWPPNDWQRVRKNAWCLEKLIDGEAVDRHRIEHVRDELIPRKREESWQVVQRWEIDQIQEKYQIPEEQLIQLLYHEIPEIVLEHKESRPVQTIRSMTPEPNYLYGMVDQEIECQECHAKFSYQKLKSDATGWGGDEDWSNVICPACGTWDCCEFQFERVDPDGSIIRAVL